MTSVTFLNVEEIIILQKSLIERFGGATGGVRDRALLESAVEQPKIILFSEYAYKDLFEMGATYCFHIIKNHPFFDANKRIGLLAALTFFELNGIALTVSWEVLYNTMVDVASSKMSKEELIIFFKKNSK